jgi:hypothetical protein
MAFPIQIDTTQLTYGTFRIPNVTQDALDGKTVPTLQLEPGNYSLFVDAAGQTATFSITPQGTVDYQERYDRFLTGKGTIKLGIIGFEVTLDAQSLKSFGIFFVGLPPTLRERFTLKTLRLAPGLYRIQQRGGTVATFSFSLEIDGTFNYDVAHDTSNGGFLSGRGTAKLGLIGYTIQIDTTQLSYPRYVISGITPTPLEGKTIQTLQLLPDAYNFQNDADFSFNVTPQGQINFDPALSNFLAGQASKTLTISGLPVTLDGQRFPRGILLIAISAFIKRETVRLVPGLYRVQQTGGAVANFTFKLERDGTFSYDPAFDKTSGGFLIGRGTSTLEFLGYSVLFDAREYQGTSVQVHGITVPNSTSELQPIPLLPHTEISLTINTNPPAIAKFALEQNGTITLKESYPFLEVQKQNNQTILKLKQSNVNQDELLAQITKKILEQEGITYLAEFESQSVGKGPIGKPNEPSPRKPKPYLDILIDSPAKNTSFSGPASQGVTITANGRLDTGDSSTYVVIDEVKVQFGRSTPTLDATLSGWNWTCTSNRITTGGALTITVYVKARIDQNSPLETKPATRIVPDFSREVLKPRKSVAFSTG